MRIETTLPAVAWAAIPARAVAAEHFGFDSLAQSEISRDPFLPLALAGAATTRIGLATSVAIAFPRSPMVIAQSAWNLAELSGGRFALGLGTQVKGHIERRFSTQWDAPGPRLREYVLAVRAVWDTWQNNVPLNYRGQFYTLTLMTPEFSPRPLPCPLPRVQIAAVNAYNIELAGELCDGLRVHPFSTPAYVRDVIWPHVHAGAAKSGRALDSFEMIGGGFIATGATDAEVQAAREQVRYRIAFYASTRTYLPVLAHHGWEALNPALRDLIAADRWHELATVISDEVLDTFCVSGVYEVIVPALRARYTGLVDCISFPFPETPDATDHAFQRALDGIRAIPTSRELT